MNERTLYLLAAIVGAVVPWVFFGGFIADEGLDLGAFICALFVNGAAGGFSADVLISGTAFLVWSWFDSRRIDLRAWWLYLPALFGIGLSFALPLHLWRRAGSADANEVETGSGS